MTDYNFREKILVSILSRIKSGESPIEIDGSTVSSLNSSCAFAFRDYLQNKRWGIFFLGEDISYEPFKKLFQKTSENPFNIRYFCTTTFKHFLEHHLEKIKWNWLEKLEPDFGILLTSEHTYLYEIFEEEGKKFFRYYVFSDEIATFYVEVLIPFASINEHFDPILNWKDEEFFYGGEEYQKRYAGIVINGMEDIRKTGVVHHSIILFKMLFFLKFAEVETKIVDRSKKSHHVGEKKYTNNQILPIEVITSNYYTTIIRKEGFGVDGHFKFQPFGKGRTEKKLIWISDYEKKGYTRKAKIDKSRN